MHDPPAVHPKGEYEFSNINSGEHGRWLSDFLGGEHEPQAPQPQHLHCPTLQMKGRWESNLNVWFPFMYSQKWNSYFQSRIITFCLPVLTLIYLWEIYIFPGLVCLFCCSEICGPILGIHKSLTDTWMGKLGLRPSNSQKKEYINGIFLAVQLSSAKNTQSQKKCRLTYSFLSTACLGLYSLWK